MADDQEKQFELTTTAQVERVYRVRAKDSEQAHKRLRRWLEDSDALREDLVSEVEAKRTDKTPQRVVTESIHELTAPGAPAPAASANGSSDKSTSTKRAAAAAKG